MGGYMKSYPKIYNLGNVAIDNIFDSNVQVEEKADGSNYSFGFINGELVCRSKTTILNILAPEKMFNLAVATSKELQPLLKPDWVYRTEYLAKPRHNALHYDRIPNKHLLGFDIERSDGTYLTYAEKKEEFARLGLETVPLLYDGKVSGYELFRTLVDNTVSILGGAKVEGVVVKNYNVFGQDGNILLGKFVSEAFKEVHKGPKLTQSNKDSIVDTISSMYHTKARWNKAIQHLKERGELTTSLKDIPLLLKEISSDTKLESESEIKDLLFKWAWGKISKKIIEGFPEYYKEYLIKQTFED